MATTLPALLSGARITAASAVDHQSAADLTERFSGVGGFYLRVVLRNPDESQEIPAVVETQWSIDGKVVETSTNQWRPWSEDLSPNFGAFLHKDEPVEVDGGEHDVTAVLLLADKSRRVVEGHFGPPPPEPISLLAAAILDGGGTQGTADLAAQALEDGLGDDDLGALLDGLRSVDPARLSVDQLGVVADLAVAANQRHSAAAAAVERDTQRLREALGG